MKLNLYEISLLSSISNANNSLRLRPEGPIVSFASMKKIKRPHLSKHLEFSPNWFQKLQVHMDWPYLSKQEGKVKTAPLC